MTPPVHRLMRGAILTGLVVGVPAAILAAVLQGPKGLWTAVGAVVLVAGGVVSTAAAWRWAAPRGAAMVQAVMAGGFLARLGVYVVLIVTLAPTDLVDGPTLALVVPTTTFLVLAVESRIILGSPEFRMVDATATQPGKDPQ